MRILGPFILALAATLLGCSLVDRLLPPRLDPPPTLPAAPTPVPRSTATPAAAVDLGPEMEEIQGQVSSVRGLYPTGPLERELLPPEAMRQKVIDDFLGDYSEEEAADDARVLVLLGLLDPGFALWNFYVDFYEEQVAGYYDTETSRMYVVGSGWGGAERLTYAHEYVHALQDQHYDIEDGLGYSDDGCEADSERCAAVSALIEGDASLAEEQWWRSYATEQDYQDLAAAIAEYDGAVFDSAPNYMQRDFLFPYTEGLAFVQDLFRKGGWAAVDAAYLDPPTTTEHILHPELYGKAEPIAVTLADPLEALGETWREVDVDVLGEWFTQLVLAERIPEWEAAEAAAGWGGDQYLALFNDDLEEGALVLHTRWDRSRDAYEFVEAFHEYASLRFGDRTTEQTDRRWTWKQGSVILERVYDQTLWILAPGGETAQVLREAVTFPASP